MRAWSGWLRSLGILMVASWTLSACGGNGETGDSLSSAPAETAESVVGPSEEVESAASEANTDTEVSPFPEPVDVTATGVQRPDGRLRVEGRTNLPDATELVVIVERRASGVRWRIRTSVNDGHFLAEPLGPGSGLPRGEYSITVSMQPASVQPGKVRAVIGEQGEYLRGPLTSESRHQGTIVEYSTPFTFDPNTGSG
ncbi:hypothetical protein GCM10007160_19070 [Litchfieldella qijiaojingensis]|uniref:Uncharacterized protein n=1 Tax=Litchfieldella qijiaojingensis TaxID=980347 RepID=A0ABQ2YQ50_9GAMM|nr:hypothetical protein [Halomonas qijiaojingensis]GGX91769.1 hypothetical protein GCM10007160_19070 [Halomonas qijiaojingensis]